MEMDYEKKNERHISICLECGDKIRYGRTDKKFCCEDCKNKHHNKLAKAGRVLKNKILGSINKNYEILDDLVRRGVDSIGLAEMMAIGFAPGIMTSYRKTGKHDEYTCYDIRYIMTKTRIYSISKIQNLYLPLRLGEESVTK